MSGGHDEAGGRVRVDAAQDARGQVVRAVTAMAKTAGRLAPRATLVTLSAAALAPLLPMAGSGAATVALAGVFGNVGSNLLTGAIERALRRSDTDQSMSLDAFREDLVDELTRLLDTQPAPDVAVLQNELLSILDAVGGIDVAIDTAHGELRSYLASCFDGLLDSQLTTLDRLDMIEAEQRRQGDWLQEVRDRLRRRDAPSDEPAAGAGPPGRPIRSGAFSPTVVASGTGPPDPTPRRWEPGAEIIVDDRVYLLHATLFGEGLSRDGGSMVHRARGLRLVPAPRPGAGYVWLRQVRRVAGAPGDRSGHKALRREHDLLASLGRLPGLPCPEHVTIRGATTTSVLAWPGSRSRRVPCDTLADLVELAGTPVDDTWRLSRLFAGLAGLCDTLALIHGRGVAHRALTPSGLISLDDGRLVLRDLGLAAHEVGPGEGPVKFQAPEQRRDVRARPGAATDAYQVAAIAYHLLMGQAPHASHPVPVTARAGKVPKAVATAVDTALSAHPGDRPEVRALGATFRAAHEIRC